MEYDPIKPVKKHKSADLVLSNHQEHRQYSDLTTLSYDSYHPVRETANTCFLQDVLT